MRPLLSEQKRNCGQATRDRLKTLHRYTGFTLRRCNDLTTNVGKPAIDFPSRLDLARVDPLDRKAGDLSRIFQLKFFLNVRPVSFHGLWTKM